jgi:GntR family transcriptional regulator, phosphonate transport system regulatory protein
MTVAATAGLSIGESSVMSFNSEQRALDGATESALWKRIAASLRDEIRSQILRPGQQMMTEVNLADRFGVSRFTVRKALAGLEQEGLVRIEHGRGIFVAEDVVQYALGERTRWSENMERSRLRAERQVIASAIEEADADVRRNLELPFGADVVFIESSSAIDGRPLGLGRAYFPAERFPGLGDLLRRDPSRTKAFRQFGIADYKRKTTRIVSRLPTSREARLLRIAKTRPILQTEKIDVDLHGKPISYGIVCYCGDRIELIVG